MRKNFEIQYHLGITPIEKVVIPLKSRDELPPVMRALQFIFTTPEVNEKVFAIIDAKVNGGKPKINKGGRPGMSLWEILVICTVRHTLNTNYDQLHSHVSYNTLIRSIMGIENCYGTDRGQTYGLQTIKDNSSLLDAATINQINEIVVAQAHDLVLKKNEMLRLKSDTYVLKTNVHFPTDLNLLWDATRKVIDIMGYCTEVYKVSGWRKRHDRRSDIKAKMRSTSKACASTSKNKAQVIENQVLSYLAAVNELKEKVIISTVFIKKAVVVDFEQMLKQEVVLDALTYYMSMITKHVDLIERRLLKGEVIPTSEKLYSIFETHTEWISKGKQGTPVELGRKILITTDQHHFILAHKIIKKTSDVNLTIELADTMLNLYQNIQSWSMDKGFYSKDSKELLALYIPEVIIPKKGNLNIGERESERQASFKKLRNAHSAVESNINQLEHNGLDMCPDKGEKAFERYVAIGILSYNLHRLGSLLLQKERAKENAKKKRQAKRKELLKAA